MTKTVEKVTGAWLDIEYYYVLEFYDCYMDFRVYELFYGKQFQRAGASFRPDLVSSVDEAEVYLSGSVKLDECNVRFDKDNYHSYFGLIIGRLYDMAKKVDGELKHG